MVFKKLFGRKNENVVPAESGGQAYAPLAPHGFTIHVSDGGSWQAFAFPTDVAEIGIGRSNDNAICLPKGSVSKRHASIENRGGALVFRDLGGSSPCLVNESPTQECALRDGDRIQIGGFTLALQVQNSQITSPEPSTAGPLRREAILAEINRRLGEQGKIVEVDDDLQLRTQSMGHPVMVSISDNMWPSICVKAQNTRGLIMLMFDPDATDRAIDPSDPWDQGAEAAERSFVGNHVFIQQMMDLAQERANFEALPDWQQWVRLHEAQELGALVASFDELQISYYKGLEQLDSPVEHLFSTIQLAIRSAEFLASGKTPIIEDLGGVYINGQKVDGGSRVGASAFANCQYCHAASPLHYLRCNNCGAALSVPNA